MQKVHRINLDLGPKSYRALKDLQKSMEAASQAETLRVALQTLAKLADEAKQGGRLIVERKNGERVEISLPLVV